MFENELGIIGIGKIGSALLGRILSSDIIPINKVIIYDIDENKCKEKSIEFGVNTAKNNEDLVKKSKYIIIAVIPQVIDDVLTKIGSIISNEQIIISIAAGISFQHINKFINERIALIRVMTNTPALIGAAATAIAHNSNVKKEQLDFVNEIFKAVGIVVELDEVHLDAVTGLSGSGPAYIFIIIEALADGGVKMGLSREVSLKLAAQTVMGSAKLLIDTKKHPGELKDMVATPAGTTITAIHELELAKIRATLIRAVEAATLKSKALNSSSK